ncbi:MAG: hypothetical protein CMP76_06895 [Flavobacterium sp.]|uniref:alpha/beta hydrolase n=1 Tax=Flavobacterium sp. TaxID=239 RepID=UPI000C364C02|nr:alpha/beta fold hydrolase [Flavobacterium sp.]MBF03008.1 hypothetical protein [Flavobacterium sp.]
MQKKRKVIRFSLIILIVIGLLFLHFYVPRFITEIKNPLIESFKSKQPLQTTESFKDSSLNGTALQITSFDGIALSCYITYSNTTVTKGTVILLHGIRSRKEHFVALCERLANAGYHAVAVDLRAHGKSGGTHCTFGVKEKKDISKIIDYLITEEKITTPIGVWGQSLGGAIGLQAMGTDKRIAFGIIESTFTDFETITHDYFQFHLGFNWKPLTHYLVHRAGKIADFNPEEAKPIAYCEKITQPILLVHGNQDQRISITYAKENYAAIPSLQKEFLEIDQANHLNVWKVGGDAYFEKVIGFMDRN